jgi:hypothetical protein
MDSANYENHKYIIDSMSKRNIPTTTEKYTVTPFLEDVKETSGYFHESYKPYFLSHS